MTIPKDNSQLENARRLRSEMTPRFSNRDVDMDFRGVCTQIDITIQKRL